MGMCMSVALGSCANVREVLELMEVIESTRFTVLPNSWRERTSRPLDYHSGRTGTGGIRLLRLLGVS